jgi:hypothetical protein
MRTPKHIRDSLHLMIRDSEPRARTLGRTPATHYQRLRATFEDKNIVGIGISDKITEKSATGTLCLTFYVEKKLSKRKMKIGNLVPPVIAAPDGRAVFTDVKQIGRPRLQANVHQSPVQSGYSVGHISVTAGTVAAIVKKAKKYFILSNSHILAMSGKAKIGDPIVYPGPADGGTVPKSQVAALTQFVALQPGDTFANHVDAALAEIDKDHMSDLDFEILGIKKTVGVIEPVRGMTVVKRGRTSGDTESTVRDADFHFLIEYPGIGQVGFAQQVQCDSFTSPGDSGSLVIDKASGKVVGLHFCSVQGASIFNPIQAVMKALNFDFTTS